MPFLVVSCGVPGLWSPDASDALEGAPADAGPPAPASFVVRRVLAGDTDPSLRPDPNGWRTLGEDLDGRVTDAQSTDVCQLSAGASSSVQIDGQDGIDNSFGANVIPAIVAAGVASPSIQWAQSTRQGVTRVILVRIDALQDPSDAASGALYVGTTLAGPANLDGTDVWPLSALSVSAGDASRPIVRLVASVHAGALVANASAQATVFMPFNSGVLAIPIQRAQIRATLAPGSMSGTLAGIVPTEVLIEAARRALGGIKPSLCSGAMFDVLATRIRQAQDILSDGTQDPGKPCDAISIGLGIDAVGVVFGPVRDDPGAPPCP